MLCSHFADFPASTRKSGIHPPNAMGMCGSILRKPAHNELVALYVNYKQALHAMKILGSNFCPALNASTVAENSNSRAFAPSTSLL